MDVSILSLITGFASVAKFVQQNACNLLTCKIKVEVFYSRTKFIVRLVCTN